MDQRERRCMAMVNAAGLQTLLNDNIMSLMLSVLDEVVEGMRWAP